MHSAVLVHSINKSCSNSVIRISLASGLKCLGWLTSWHHTVRSSAIHFLKLLSNQKTLSFFFFFFFHVLSRKIGKISLKCSENTYKYFVISDFYAEKFVICGYFLTHRGIGTPGELQKTCYKQKFVISEFVISGLDCKC